MTPRPQPRVFRGGLTGRIFIATKWAERNGRVEAIEKYDITDQLRSLGLPVDKEEATQ